MDYTSFKLDHLSVSEELTSDPWTEARLFGSLEFSAPSGAEISPALLDGLVRRFCIAVREWLANP